MSAHYPSSGAAGQQPPRGPGNPSDMPPLGSSGSYAPQISAADAYRYMPQPTGQDVTASIDTEMTDSYAPYANGYEHCNGHSEPLVNGVGDHVGYYPEDESDQQTSSSQDYSTRRNWSDGRSVSLDTVAPVPGIDYQDQDSQRGYFFTSPGETEFIDAPMDGVVGEPSLDYPPQGGTWQQLSQVQYGGYLLPPPPDPESRDSGVPYESVGDSDVAGAGTWVEDERMSNLSFYQGRN